jgi:hypothetical protein
MGTYLIFIPKYHRGDLLRHLADASAASSTPCRRGFALLGLLISTAAAYLGGHLVSSEQIGVDHHEMRADLEPTNC